MSCDKEAVNIAGLAQYKDVMGGNLSIHSADDGSWTRSPYSSYTLTTSSTNCLRHTEKGDDMKVTVTQLTPWSLALDAARATMGKAGLGNEPSDEWKRKLLECEHSVIRRVRYEIKIEGLKSWVSVHLVRHKFGVEHFVQSQRDDRNPDRQMSRDDMPQGTPINHTMDINAQEVMFMSRRRLCGQASLETRQVWQAVRREMEKIDPTLAEFMVPMCVYRKHCPELKPCGFWSQKTRGLQIHGGDGELTTVYRQDEKGALNFVASFANNHDAHDFVTCKSESEA